MEKGLKALQTAARRAQRSGSITSASGAVQQQASGDDSGNSDHASDSGIGMGSDTEMEVGHAPPGPSSSSSPSWHTHTVPQHSGPEASYPSAAIAAHHQQAAAAAAAAAEQHARSRSLPQIPLYRPPPPPVTAPMVPHHHHQHADQQRMYGPNPAAMAMPSYRRYSPDSQNGRGGISIQAMLAD